MTPHAAVLDAAGCSPLHPHATVPRRLHTWPCSTLMVVALLQPCRRVLLLPPRGCTQCCTVSSPPGAVLDATRSCAADAVAAGREAAPRCCALMHARRRRLRPPRAHARRQRLCPWLRSTWRHCLHPRLGSTRRRHLCPWLRSDAVCSGAAGAAAAGSGCALTLRALMRRQRLRPQLGSTRRALIRGAVTYARGCARRRALMRGGCCCHRPQSCGPTPHAHVRRRCLRPPCTHVRRRHLCPWLRSTRRRRLRLRLGSMRCRHLRPWLRSDAACSCAAGAATSARGRVQGQTRPGRCGHAQHRRRCRPRGRAGRGGRSCAAGACAHAHGNGWRGRAHAWQIDAVCDVAWHAGSSRRVPPGCLACTCS
jgi:hypothetical protein